MTRINVDVYIYMYIYIAPPAFEPEGGIFRDPSTTEDLYVALHIKLHINHIKLHINLQIGLHKYLLRNFQRPEDLYVALHKYLLLKIYM